MIKTSIDRYRRHIQSKKEQINVAQCVEGIRPQPFISDQAAYLSKWRSCVLTRGGVYTKGWSETPIYEAYGSNPLWVKAYNRVWDTTIGVPKQWITILKENKVRLLHAHHGMFAINFLSLARRFQIPLVVSFYGYDASGFPSSSPINASRLIGLFSESTLVIAMSKNMKEDLIHWGCPEKKILIHHTGVDLDRFPYRPKRLTKPCATILCVCDFTPKKGIYNLIKAFKGVLHSVENINLRIIGSPITDGREEYDRVLQLIQAECLENWITFVGRVDHFELAEEYRQADLFVLASATAPDGSKEGIPAVLMEAQSIGLPVISTYHAGISEAVVHEETGYLVKENDINALEKALIALLTNRYKRETMGRRGRLLMETNFDVRKQRIHLEEIYDYAAGDTHLVPRDDPPAHFPL